MKTSDDVLRQLKELTQRIDERDKELKKRRAALKKPKSSIDEAWEQIKLRMMKRPFGGYPIPDDEDDWYDDDDHSRPLRALYELQSSLFGNNDEVSTILSNYVEDFDDDDEEEDDENDIALKFV